ncbi:MAG: sigma-70 family RNA polymerase sigma factor [Mariniblastus sp.]|nr:sigma-70 family RNA polymerase sigma factor [Mariniblastus sp.]
MNDVTQILNAIQQGDAAASERLFPLVYDELRRLAQSRMRHESSDQTLQPTALVHEVYLRLVDVKNPQTWNSKGHFFGAAATAMRRILIENARRKKTLRRGGDRQRVQVETLDFCDPNDSAFLIALDNCLEQLEKEKPEIAQVVNLRFFGGLTNEQCCQAMEISLRTVNRHWAFAKAWLYQKLSEEHGIS